MKISVITVTYNCATTIKDTIENVLTQGYEELEYIIIDGGSTDGTLDIIKKYSDKIAYWCSESDEGIYDAMNKGILKCTGEFVAFMNSGDWYERGALSAVAECVDQAQADIIYGNHIVVDEQGRQTAVVLDDWNIEELYYRWPMCHQAIFFRRSLFGSIGLYDLSYRIASDYEWILRAYSNSAHFFHLSRNVCYYVLGGYSAVHEKVCIQDIKRARIRWMPKKREDEYLPLIESDFYNAMSALWIKDFNQSLVRGDNLAKNKMETILRPINEKAIVFGAGRIGKKYVDLFHNIGISLAAIMDNNSNVWGTEIHGIRIQEPILLSENYVIVAVKDKYHEISLQLQQMGYEKEKIIDYLDLEQYMMKEWLKE